MTKPPASSAGEALGPEAFWRAALAEGRLLVQRSVEDGSYVFPPRAVAPNSGGKLEWVEASGLGTVYSVTLINPRPPEPPYNVVLVDLLEGVRMMSRVEGIDAAEIRIGMRVRAHIDRSQIVLFRPAGT